VGKSFVFFLHQNKKVQLQKKSQTCRMGGTLIKEASARKKNICGYRRTGGPERIIFLLF